jgi:hypothetical protein
VRSIVLPSWIERLAGLTPRALAPHAFGISRRELTYAGFADGEGSGSGPRALLEAQSVPLPEGLFGTGPLGVPVGDRATFAEAARLLVGRLSKAPKVATIVLPDAWARGLMIDSADLPEEPEARHEVLRFKLSSRAASPTPVCASVGSRAPPRRSTPRSVRPTRARPATPLPRAPSPASRSSTAKGSR